MEQGAPLSELRKGTGRISDNSGPRVSRRAPVLRLSHLKLLIPGVLLIGLLMTQGVASGATTVTTHAPAKYAVTHVGAPTAPPVSVGAIGDVVANPGQAGLGSAGTQAAGPGMTGTPLTLPACAAAACRDRYIVASPAGLTVGDYAERAMYTVTQPVTPPGVSTGFMVEMVVHTSTGWIVGRAYVATGTTAFAGGSVITLVLFLNLGTAAAPTILGAFSVVDKCSSTTVCP